MELTKSQISDLAKPFVGMVQAIKEFYQNPENEKAYREWHRKKYGVEPKDEV